MTAPFAPVWKADMRRIDDGSPDREKPRRGWLRMLQLWRREGAIDDADEGALIRHYDERRDELRQALSRLVPEYERRVRTDGLALADDWLRDVATQLGREDGESTRRMLSSLAR